MSGSGSFLTLIKNIQQLGWREAHRQALRMNSIKVGTLVGTDQFGNKYFKNDNEHSGRNRWVDYAQYDFNGSQVPFEWHRWLNHIQAEPPTEDANMMRNTPAWQTQHQENLTGTRGAYKSYSTTAPKYIAWEPKVAQRQ